MSRDSFESSPISTTPDLGGPSRPDFANEPSRKSWQDGVGPAYLGLFLLIVFFDRLGRTTLDVGGLIPSLLGAALGGMLAFGMLFYAPALRGLTTRLDLAPIGSRSFGTIGGRWLPVLVLALVHVVWFAVAIFYAADLSLKALAMADLIGSESLDAPVPDHAAGLGGPVFLFTITLWMLAAAFLGPLLVKIVGAILYVYTIFPAILLAGLMLWALGGLAEASPILTVPGRATPAFWMMVQLVFGYTASAGLIAVEWGAASRTRRDVRLGGLLGVGITPALIVSIAMVTILGTQGEQNAHLPETTTESQDFDAPSDPLPGEPHSSIYHEVVIVQGIGGAWGCLFLMTFCLALLGPACYAPAIFCRRFRELFPRFPLWSWSLLGIVVAWPMAATGLAGRLPTIFGLLGAVVAPLLGVLAADLVRDRGQWNAAHRRFDLTGWLAWVVGMSVGLLPYLGVRPGIEALERIQPAAVLAWVAAFMIRLVLDLRRRSEAILVVEQGEPPHAGPG